MSSQSLLPAPAWSPDTDEEIAMLRDSAAGIADREFRPRAAHWDAADEAPMVNLPILAEAGLAGVTVPEQYGGSGGNVIHAMIAIEEISRVCVPTAGMILGNAVSTEMLVKFGSEEQRQTWLPALARGEKLSAWAMTEPEAGSAATELSTTATNSQDGYLLSGSKVFITRAAIADFFIVFARVGKVPGAKGIAAFLVEKATPGLSVGNSDRHLGFRGAASAEVVLDECRVPEENLLVPPGDFGKMMRGLNIARVLNPTFCLGMAREALALALKYSQERRQFGRELASFQGLQWMLADMHVKVEGIKLLIYRAAYSVANDLREAPMHCAVAKVYANEAGFEVVDRALQIHGGYGYSSEFPLERMLRDIRGLQIAGGSTQTLRNTIAAGILKRRIDQRG